MVSVLEYEKKLIIIINLREVTEGIKRDQIVWVEVRNVFIMQEFGVPPLELGRRESWPQRVGMGMAEIGS